MKNGSFIDIENQNLASLDGIEFVNSKFAEIVNTWLEKALIMMNVVYLSIPKKLDGLSLFFVLQFNLGIIKIFSSFH